MVETPEFSYLQAKIPASTAVLFRPYLERIVEAVCAEIAARSSGLRELDESILAPSVTMVVAGFIELVESRQPPPPEWRETGRALGRRLMQVGVPVNDVRTYLRVGARVAWRHAAQISSDMNMPSNLVAILAEAIFVYCDEVAAVLVEGYSGVASASGNELRRQRQALLRTLLTTSTPEPCDVSRDLAQATGWVIPRTVAVVVLADSARHEQLVFSLPPDVLIDLDRPEPCLLVPDPEGPARRRGLERALRGRVAVLGLTVPLCDAAKSLRWASMMLNVVREGMVGAGGLIRCADYLGVLVLAQDVDMMRALVTARLGPLLDLGDDRRDRLTDTMLLWLQTGQNTAMVAEQLHVHPQTVRYRVRRLRALFGDRLEEPKTRLELLMALRAHQLLERAAVGTSRFHPLDVKPRAAQ